MSQLVIAEANEESRMPITGTREVSSGEVARANGPSLRQPVFN